MANSKKRILVVEDDGMLSIMYKTKFQADGYEVLTADNGVDALNLIKEGGVDLVMLDIILPQMDGFSVLGEMKKDAKTKKIPVIMLTNLATDEDRQKGEKLGAADYLVKADLTPEQVSKKIKEHLK